MYSFVLRHQTNGNIEALSGATQQSVHGNVEAPLNRQSFMAPAELAVELFICCSSKSFSQAVKRNATHTLESGPKSNNHTNKDHNKQPAHATRVAR
jgi:hypothetical protein